MGVYTSTKKLDTFDESAVNVIECKLEPGIEAAINIVAESEENYNKIMQAIGVHELSIYESTGVEMVYEAVDLAALLNKAKEFFMNILEKIKGLFKRFFAMIDSYIKSDADFVKQYAPKIINADTKGLKVKGFKFSNVDSYELPSQSTMGAVYDSEVDTSNSEDIQDSLRGKVLGKSEKIESGELSKELFKYFRSDEDSKIEIETIVPREQLKLVQATKELKTKAEKNYKKLTDAINDIIKDLEKQAKASTTTAVAKDTTDADSTAASGNVRKLNAHIQYAKDSIGVLQIANGAHLSAIRDQNRQAKSICVALVGFKAKHESYSFTDSTNESFLSGVVLK